MTTDLIELMACVLVIAAVLVARLRQTVRRRTARGRS